MQYRWSATGFRWPIQKHHPKGHITQATPSSHVVNAFFGFGKMLVSTNHPIGSSLVYRLNFHVNITCMIVCIYIYIYFFFSRKTFRRRVLQKIVGVSHTTHIPHISITPHISHTYPFKTYPTNTYPTNTYPFNTYPTNTYPFNTYPTNTYPCNAYPFNTYPFKRSASAGMANVSHQYMSHQYVSVQHVSHQYVSIQCVSIQKVCISGNGNVCECKTYPCMSLHQQEWQWVWVSLHVISYHCYSAGMVMKIETLLFLQFLCNIINCI